MASIEPSKSSLNPSRWHRPYSWITASAIIQFAISTLLVLGYVSWQNRIATDPDQPSGMFGAVAGLAHVIVAIPAVFASFLAIAGGVIMLISLLSTNRNNKVKKVGYYLSLLGLGIMMLEFLASPLISEFLLYILQEFQVAYTTDQLGLLNLSVMVSYSITVLIGLASLIKGWKAVRRS